MLARDKHKHASLFFHEFHEEKHFGSVSYPQLLDKSTNACQRQAHTNLFLKIFGDENQGFRATKP